MTRDEFIFKKLQETVWRGKCWHEWHCVARKGTYGAVVCKYCGIDFAHGSNPDFSTWEGFGMLLEGMQERADWRRFLIFKGVGYIFPQDRTTDPERILIRDKYINPPVFADAVGKFFGWEGK